MARLYGREHRDAELSRRTALGDRRDHILFPAEDGGAGQQVDRDSSLRISAKAVNRLRRIRRRADQPAHTLVDIT